MFARRHPELLDDLVMTSSLELCVEQILESREPHSLQSERLVREEALDRKVEGFATPERQCVRQHFCRRGRVTIGEQCPAASHP